MSKIKSPIQVRKAKASDAAAVRSLNGFWREAHTRGRLDKGFHTTEFSAEQFAALIDAGDVVVATLGGTLVGYYLVNSVHEHPTVSARKMTVAESIAAQKLPQGRYAYITQAAVHPDHMRKGIGKRMLALLKKQLKDRFDYLVGRIDGQNKNGMAAHLRSGWRVFAEVPGGYLAVASVRD